ncbi:hypothetical protein PAXRUDRAFT_827147 [Paxillus rubicundulus Ve08.2h10]|uniref:Uncharacterized protein n=1 Tax=Paxillus rubicundulus Ve08.2h10 TaxID=930991 RepID=A0A0D0E8X6_9AGAM|nr:hypothetical protein PAXRUDRAFT_827147 [Paxillus rubicundulus Ve08.2h10]
MAVIPSRDSPRDAVILETALVCADSTPVPSRTSTALVSVHLHADLRAASVV